MGSQSGTISVVGDEAEAHPVALLTYVLGYDDLLADDGEAFVALRGRAGQLSIGRSHERRARSGILHLADRRVSSEHALMRRVSYPSSGPADQRERLVDTIEHASGKSSKNGTFVNGEPLPPGGTRELADGDLIEVGHSLLCYRRTTEAEAVRLTETDVAGVEFGPTRTRCPGVIQRVDELLRVAPSNLRLLLRGETGVGKDGAAQFVHEKSLRADKRNIVVNCPAIPTEMFEAAFFGYVKGAFTGAAAGASGYLSQANGGTLFLDEIGSLAPAHQAKILRVIEAGAFRRLGLDKDEGVDVRWIAATNEDVRARLRTDILYRIAEHVCHLPPLRGRREDLGAVAAEALRRMQIDRGQVAITPQAARAFFLRPFPGNLRELAGALRRAALNAGAGAGANVTICVEDLPPDEEALPAPEATVRTEHDAPRSNGPPKEAEIRRALACGSKVAAARALGVTPRHLDRLLEKLGIADEYRRR